MRDSVSTERGSLDPARCSINARIADCLWHGGKGEESRKFCVISLASYAILPSSQRPRGSIVHRERTSNTLTRVFGELTCKSVLATHASQGPQFPLTGMISRTNSALNVHVKKTRVSCASGAANFFPSLAVSFPREARAWRNFLSYIRVRVARVRVNSMIYLESVYLSMIASLIPFPFSPQAARDLSINVLQCVSS